jgi:ribosomal protein S6--L-glutamate ligase
MKLLSFDALRTLSFPAHDHLKPEQYWRHKDRIQAADFVLFPEYWQLNALVYGLGARVFPSEASYRIGHNKIEMTRVFQTVCPANTPDTLILSKADNALNDVLEIFDYPFVAKIPKSSRGEGVFLIENSLDWVRYYNQTDTIYVQEYLPIDRDLRLVLLGEKVVGGYWRLQAEQGFYNNLAQGGTMMAGQLPIEAVRLVEDFAKQTGVDHAGFDVAMVGQHPYLIEFNRLFGTQGVNAVIGDTTGYILEYLEQRLISERPIEPTTPRRKRRLRTAA